MVVTSPPLALSTCCQQPLPCACCQVPNRLVLHDCAGAEMTIFNDIIIGPVETQKLDGMQRHGCSIADMEAYLTVPVGFLAPPRGSIVSVGEIGNTQFWKLAEHLVYGCDACFTLRRPYLPCDKEVTLYEEIKSHLCDGTNTQTTIGLINVSLFYLGVDEDRSNENRKLKRTAWAYPAIPVGLLPFSPEINHRFDCDGATWRITGFVSGGSIDLCEYWEVEEVGC